MSQAAEELKAAGNAAYAAGDNAKALQCYEQAIGVAGESLLHVLHSNASAAAVRLGRADAALQHARRCIELAPSFAKGYGRLAAAAHAASRPGEAEAALRRGLKACAAGEAAGLQQELDKLLKDDGDQSPLRGFLPGTPAQNMRDYQSEYGMRMHLPPALAALPCDAFRAAFLGDERAFKASFRPAEHISLRAWELRLPLTSVIVSGAQRVSYVTDRPTGSGHAAIMRAVCEAGARVNARDIAGYTALAHATAHHPQLELARILVEFGADASLPTRFGSAPLHSACLAFEEESVQLLLDAGADPDAKDLDGCSVESVALHSPAILAMIHKAQGKYQQHADLQRGGACFACGKLGATKTCTGCLSAIYCDRACQRAHWKAHKKECKKGAAAGGGGGAAASSSGSGSGGGGGQLRVKPASPEQFPFSMTISRQQIAAVAAARLGLSSKPAPELAPRMMGPQEMAAAARRDGGKTFVVKVQVLVGPASGSANPSMLIYSKTRSYQCHVDEGGSADARRLAHIVRTQGWNGQKAYFTALVDAGSGELVLSDAPLPTQPW